MELPNLPDERSPAGGKEANQVVRTWGSKPELGDRPLDHVELCTRLGLIDYARGAKLGGNGYWIYRREAGSYRSEERGTIRGLQFNKVEMFQFTAPEDGERALDELVGRSQMLVEKLGLHY